MAGKPGKGGQPGRSGGARPGAGRPPKAPDSSSAGSEDMLQLLKDIATGKIDATATQVKAAIAAVAYTHAKVGEGGKKDQRADKAKQASQGKFASAAPPRLVISNK